MRRRGFHAALTLVVVAGGCARDNAVESAFRAADSLKLNGRFADALPRYAALKDSLVHADSGVRWRAQTGWAEGLLRTGKLPEAAAALDDARGLAGGDSLRLGQTRYVRSLLLHRQGKLDSALVEAQGALLTAQALGNRALEVDAHSVHGTVYSLSGRYRLAAAHAESALAIERTLARPPQHLTVRFNNLGIEYRHLGRLTEADRLFREGLVTARTLPTPRYVMLLNANMSNVRLMAGNPSEALRLREESLRAAETLNDAQGIVVSNADIGDLYLDIGNPTAARRHYERSLAANTPVRFMYGKIQVLWGLGRLETEERHAGAAMRRLQEGMLLADSGGWGRERSEIRAARAHAALAAGDAGTALRWADAALRLADSVDDVEARLRALEARAAALDALGRRAAADTYLEAIDLLESWRGRIALGDLRIGVAQPYWHVYEGAIRTLLARGEAPGAWAVAERAKARMLLELMAERDASRPAASAAAGQRERLRVLVEERGGARGDSARSALDGEIAATIDSLGAIERRERERDAAGAARHPSPASLGDLQTHLLRDGRTLLEFFWGERDVYGWSLTADGVHGMRLGAADSLGALIEFLRATLESPAGGDEWRAPAARAHAAFVAPLVTRPLGDVVVVADGPLAHLPFEVMLEPTQRVVYGPSASVLQGLAAATDSSWARAALVVGDPTGRSDAMPETTRGAERLGPLPYAGAEARAIYDLFAPAGADLLLRKNATLARWQALDPSRYRFLHFAAHALVSDREPELTHLVLADSGLDLAAIRRLRLSAQLVSLSACETALGLRVRGEGVIGLPHAFLAAGARGVVVTLWRVDDQAAADFMTDFYREVAAGQAPAEALRLARERRRDQHPSRWAAFVLVGAPSPAP